MVTKSFIPISKFGKDHWSTFAYIETRIVDYRGEPDKNHMRCDKDRHPAHVHMGTTDDKKYPTRLKGGTELYDHDDWDCLDDLVEASLLAEPPEWGTGLYPVYELTQTGVQVAAQLRDHRANKGNYANFEPKGFRMEEF